MRKNWFLDVSKQIHLVGELFILNIHQNIIDYSYIVDVNNVRIIDCVLMNV